VIGSRARREPAARAWDARLTSLPFYDSLANAREMVLLAGRTAKGAVVPPYPWFGECLREAETGIRRSLIPMVLSISFFAVGIVITSIGGILNSVGTIDRLGGGMSTGWPREVAFWVTGMVFAGVVGAALTADLGARKVREELDAIAVLGVDVVKTLVVPRVVALMIIAPILGLVAILNALAILYVTLPVIQPNLQASVYLESVLDFATTADIVSFVLRMIVTGAFVGIVSAYKGLSCKGGTEGVGRAVNQCVAVTFFGIWALNGLWNALVLASFPEIQQLRG